MKILFEKTNDYFFMPNGIYSNNLSNCFTSNYKKFKYYTPMKIPEIISWAFKDERYLLEFAFVAEHSRGIFPILFSEPSFLSAINCNYFINVCLSGSIKEKINNKDIKLIIFIDGEPINKNQFYNLYNSLIKNSISNFLIFSNFLPTEYEKNFELQKKVKRSSRSECWNHFVSLSNREVTKFKHNKNIIANALGFSANFNNYDFRAAAAYALFKKGLDKHCYISYNSDVKIIKNFTTGFEKINKLLNNSDVNFELSKSYKRLDEKLISKTKISLVLEAYLDFEIAKEVYPTEKSIRSIKNKQIFVLLGQAGTLKELKRMGYKTFDNYIDESYDSILDNSNRFQAVISEFVRIVSLPSDKLETLLEEVDHILKYNYNLYLEKIEKQLKLLHIKKHDPNL